MIDIDELAIKANNKMGAITSHVYAIALCKSFLAAVDATRNTGLQPIETAPKDRDILLLCPRRGCVRGRWSDEKYASKPIPYWTNDRVNIVGTRETRADQPTHWMPLPDVPK